MACVWSNGQIGMFLTFNITVGAQTGAHGETRPSDVIGRPDQEVPQNHELGASEDPESSRVGEDHERSHDENGSIDLPPTKSGRTGPPEWLDEARSQMRDSNPYRRREALSLVLKRVLSETARDDDGGNASIVHKAVLRAVSSLLLDGAFMVREEARGTLDKLATCYPHVRSLCVKYAGQQLTTAAPARLRLFVIDTIKNFILDALALHHERIRASHGCGRSPEARAQAGAPGPPSDESLWSEGARLAGLESLRAYIEEEQFAARDRIFQHHEHGMLVETVDANDGSPLEVVVVSSGEMLWRRASYLDRLGAATADRRAVLEMAVQCHPCDESCTLAQETLLFLEHLPQVCLALPTSIASSVQDMSSGTDRQEADGAAGG